MDRRWGVACAVLALTVLAAPAQAQSRPGRGPWVPLWTVTYGGFRQADALVAVGPGEAWALDNSVVTAGGTTSSETAFVNYGSGVWRVAQVAPGVSLMAIDASGPAFAVAVGEAGAIYHWDGRLWRAALSPVHRRLVDVALFDANEGWAVGDLGTLVGWDGVSWTQATSPLHQVGLTAVAVPIAGEAWATGRDGGIIHLSNGTWARVANAPIVASASDIVFDGPAHALVVGRGVAEWRDGLWRTISDAPDAITSAAWFAGTLYITVDGKLKAYRDDRWSDIVLGPDATAYATTSFSRVTRAPDGAWGLATNGTIVHVTDLTATYVRPGSGEMAAIDMVGTDFGWAGGTAITTGFVGTAGGAWDRMHALPGGVAVTAIDLFSETDGWAVGRDGSGAARMWRWDGTRWSDWPIEKTWSLGDVEIVAANEAWASRGNLVARWDGASWSAVPEVPEGASAGGFAIARGGADPEGWFGSYGSCHHLHGGTWDWLPMEGAGARRELVTDIEMVTPSEGWAITASALFRYDGTAWRITDLPIAAGERVLDVSAPEPDNAWVLVRDAGLYHWDGTRWEHHDLRPMGVGFRPYVLHAVRPAGDTLMNDVWMAGAEPSVGRYRVVTPVGTSFLPAL